MKNNIASKQATSFRLTPDAMRLLTALATHLGISRSGVLEILIREQARREGLRSQGEDAV